MLEGSCRWQTGETLLKASRLIHRRRLDFSLEQDLLEISDYLQGPGKHELWVNFILHPECRVKAQDPEKGVVEIENGGIKLTLEPDKRCSLSLHRGESDPLCGWYSPSFMSWEPCWQVILKTELKGERELKTVIKWTSERC